MATLILIFGTLALYHFIMEGLVLPTLKVELIFKIINIKSKFQRIAFRKDKFSDESIYTMSNMMAYSINKFDEHNVFDLLIKSRKNRRLKKTASGKVIYDNLMSFFHDKELNPIVRKYYKYLTAIFIVNSASWIIYLIPLLPFFIVLLFIKLLHSTTREKLSSMRIRIILSFELEKKNNFSTTAGNIPIHVENTFASGRSYNREKLAECY